MQRMMFRGFFAILLTMTAAQGCGKTDSEIGSYKEAVNGEACEMPGSKSKAADGCNTCTCTDEGTWACTDAACNPDEDPGETPAPVCKDGETKGSGDGCNACVCANGDWSCTTMLCGPLPECTPGAVRDAGDGCNTCSCSGDGTWACTMRQCEEACTPGAIKAADDACNRCTCTDEGRWTCTDTACADVCPPPIDREPGLACPTVEVWAPIPEAGVCCAYGDPCRAPAEREVFFSTDECYQALP